MGIWFELIFSKSSELAEYSTLAGLLELEEDILTQMKRVYISKLDSELGFANKRALRESEDTKELGEGVVMWSLTNSLHGVKVPKSSVIEFSHIETTQLAIPENFILSNCHVREHEHEQWHVS